ncbi:hypothetical protein BC628DRAFT_1415008 [Trametes gibbosa]|uniref:RING-type domain-containing protein n=1 Tax=Trametes gibbosa TaxID=160864 RepID=A0A6G6FS78_9APHY|nr:hypothetical protein BC628DRAFT_1415008 [Trametes gibbosa]QIE48441.1 hypothetical protein [Trametes gibbosa]
MAPTTRRSARDAKASTSQHTLEDGQNDSEPTTPTGSGYVDEAEPVLAEDAPLARRTRSKRPRRISQSPQSDLRIRPGERKRRASDDCPQDKLSPTLQSLLTRALGGAKELERENNSLRKKVETLERRLDQVVEADDARMQPRRGKRKRSMNASQLKSEVEQLRKQVRRLEKSNEKHRKRIHQLSMKELKNEAEDLVAEAVELADFEVGDAAYEMRKLLREFHDIMLENSLEGEKEECGICMDPLQPRKTRSFPCQHTFCSDCVRQLKPVHNTEAEIISCPTCRQEYEREEIELIQYTASEQWDALLNVANRWARLDVRRAESSSEEEDADEFIHDDTEEQSSTTASEPGPLESTPDPPEHIRQQNSELPLQVSSRPRRRRVVVASPSDDAPGAGVFRSATPEFVPGSSTAVVADHPPSEEQAGMHPDQSHTQAKDESPSYSQSPARDKRKRLQELAEARSKKRRI